jgi:hypothetical protein
MRATVLARNGVGNCLYLGGGSAAGAISCLCVVNNSCGAEYPFVVHFGFSVTLYKCLFWANSYAKFAASDPARAVSVVLANCVFDIANVTVVSTILFQGAIRSRTYGTEPTLLPTSDTASPTPSAVVAPKLPLGPTLVLALGIGVPALFLLAVVITVAVKVAAERRRRIRDPYARVSFDEAFMDAVKGKMDDRMEKDDKRNAIAHTPANDGRALDTDEQV